MAVTTETLQRKWRMARTKAVEKGLALYDQLCAFESDAEKALAGGSLMSASANGRGSGWQSDGRIPGNITLQETADAWTRLIRCYNGAKGELICSGTPEPTDDQIGDKVDCWLNTPALSSYNDWTNMRLPTVIPPNAPATW